ncbi:MAG: hypothetical protein KDD55_08200, partial [Bdellovibrionales bacterium]|nr:hypothetical protein [Bdellovibrionales bacterium]
MQRQLRILCASVFLFFAGCSEMSETTQVATATGGVVGAGLGAIIGSTTGDAGGGVVLGALAGAGAGAAVGQVIDSHEEAVRTQDEAIERQEQVIRSQSNQIEELKRASQDSVAFRSKDITPSSSRLYEKSAMNTKEARASFGSSKPKKMRRVPVLVLKLPPSLQTPNNERVGVAPSSYLPPVPAKPSTPPAAQRPVNVSRNFAPQPPLPKKSYAEKALPRASFSETGK